MFYKNFIVYVFELFCFTIITTKCIPINDKIISKCGIKRSSPNIVNYINGGRPSNIDNWPWQVYKKIKFKYKHR